MNCSIAVRDPESDFQLAVLQRSAETLREIQATPNPDDFARQRALVAMKAYSDSERWLAAFFAAQECLERWVNA